MVGGLGVGMSCRPRHLGFDSHQEFLWRVGSCICDLLPRGGSKGPCLGEVSHHQKKFEVAFKLVLYFQNSQFTP